MLARRALRALLPLGRPLCVPLHVISQPHHARPDDARPEAMAAAASDLRPPSSRSLLFALAFTATSDQKSPCCLLPFESTSFLPIYLP